MHFRCLPEFFCEIGELALRTSLFTLFFGPLILLSFIVCFIRQILAGFCLHVIMLWNEVGNKYLKLWSEVFLVQLVRQRIANLKFEAFFANVFSAKF